MNVSYRYSKLEPSPTLALDAKAKQLAAAGTKVINFSVGELDFATPAPIIDATIASLKSGHTRYSVAGGSPALRQAIADKLLRENQLHYNINEIVCGMGAKEILFHIFLSILNEDDEVILSAPYWVSYTSHIQAAGGKAVVIPMAPADSPKRLTVDMIKSVITPRTKAIVLNSPNNPAGYILAPEELKALGEYLKLLGIWVISDEIYEYLAFDKPHASMAALVPALRDTFILVNGLSKGFAMTGFRVGYCAAPETVAKLVRTLQSHSSTCLPKFIEEAAITALQSGSSLMQPAIAKLKERRDLAVQKLQNIPQLKLVRPEGAFYIFMDIRDCLAKSQFGPDNTMAFSNYLLEKYHVAMVPGEAFGAKGYLRLSYALSTEDLITGIDRLTKALQEIVR